MYGSHIPFLVKVLEVTEKYPDPILDLGMGLSTIVMDMMAKHPGRKIVSFESDLDWYKVNEIYRSDFHEINFVGDWKFAQIDPPKKWSVALVDHAPAKQRIKEIKRLINNTQIVLVHDSEPEADKYFKYSWIYPLYKYKFDYKKAIPNTTALSNFVDLSFLKGGV